MSQASACITVLEIKDHLLLSAGTMADALIVAVREEMARLIDELGFEIVIVTPASARRIAQAYERWRKGAHPAALNSAALRARSRKSTDAECNAFESAL